MNAIHLSSPNEISYVHEVDVDFPDNPNEKIELETISGVVRVREQGQTIVLDFSAHLHAALNANQKKHAEPLIKEILKDVEPADLTYCSKTKSLLIRLDYFCSRRVLINQ